MDPKHSRPMAVVFAFIVAVAGTHGTRVWAKDLGDLDPRLRDIFPEFFPRNVPHSIPLDEVFHGGPPKDGIPALTDPRTTDAGGAGYLDPNDVILGLSVRNTARAYPIKVMNWHEVVNDVVAGVAIAVTYCPLCGTGIAFSPILDGVRVEFGVSGLLHNSDLLMYDRATDTPSLWQQALGEAVVGPRTGTRLERIPVTHARWGDWRQRHPETTVLSADTGFNRDYRRDPYDGYDQNNRLWFPVADTSDDLPPKTWIFGLLIGGEARAYPLDRLRMERVVNDELGALPIVLIAEASNPGGVRAYERGSQEFRWDGAGVVSQDGDRWTVDEDALRSEAHDSLPRIDDGFVSFWFAWSAFYPHTDVFPAQAPVDLECISTREGKWPIVSCDH